MINHFIDGNCGFHQEGSPGPQGPGQTGALWRSQRKPRTPFRGIFQNPRRPTRAAGWCGPSSRWRCC
ncbi:MAG: hypothetical protein DI535_30290, partial [Citrobacter freundii]